MKDYLTQFIPSELLYLNKSKKIEFSGKNLKTDYLINIIHELIIKYLFSDRRELKFNLWSTILRNKYGANYNYYINYLINIGFITLTSNYYVSKKSKTYSLNYFNLFDISRCYIYDKILIKKNNK